MKDGTTAGTGLTVRAMAAQLGVSKTQIHRDATAGMPMADADEARAWRLAHKDLSRSADGRIDRPQRVEAGAAERVDAHAYRRDRARNERLKADRAEIELRLLRRELVSVAEVEQFEFTSARIVRDRMEMIPPRAAADLRALILSLIPEAQREAIAIALDLHEFERRLAKLVREALADASKEIEASRHDDDETD